MNPAAIVIVGATVAALFLVELIGGKKTPAPPAGADKPGERFTVHIHNAPSGDKPGKKKPADPPANPPADPPTDESE